MSKSLEHLLRLVCDPVMIHNIGEIDSITFSTSFSLLYHNENEIEQRKYSASIDFDMMPGASIRDVLVYPMDCRELLVRFYIISSSDDGVDQHIAFFWTKTNYICM